MGPADLWLAAEALELLPSAQRVAVMSRLAAAAIGEAATFGALPLVDSDEARFDEMCDALATVECAFLDDGQLCSIYERRPQPCRLMGASWGIRSVQFELECPIDLTGDDARVVLDLDTHEDAIARVESRLPKLPTGDSRTTLASGLNALLRR